MNNTETPILTVPLGREAHDLAAEFAIQQATPQQGKRVYLNTLAVYAVHCYLNWLQIETDLIQNDSWNQGLQAVFGVADLLIPGVGKIECCPVLPGETTFLVSTGLTENTIGYVAVGLSERLDKVQLLGFSPALNSSELPQQLAIANLQPLDLLLDYIPEAVEQVVLPTTNNMIVNLSQWLENSFESSWQTLEALFSTEALNPAFSIRTIPNELNVDNSVISVSRGKRIDLGMQLLGHPVALIITLLLAEPEEERDIRLRIYPMDNQTYLPVGLQMLVLDESGDPMPELEATTRSNDNWIQLEFSGQTQEQFSVKVILGEVSITESFVI